MRKFGHFKVEQSRFKAGDIVKHRTGIALVRCSRPADLDWLMREPVPKDQIMPFHPLTLETELRLYDIQER